MDERDMESPAEDAPEQLPAVVEVASSFDLAQVEDPGRAMDVAQQLVERMASRCSGPQYIAPIRGRKYPKVEWWTTVGASLGLFPREESNVKLDRLDECAYEATVAVYRGDMVVTRASAICSSAEARWKSADEYAIRSMAATRATGKAFRLGLSFIATLAGLEPTPAEEMPGDEFSAKALETPADDLDLSDPATEEQTEQIRALYLKLAPVLSEPQKARCKQAMHGTTKQAEKTIEWLTDKANSLAGAGA